MGSENPLSANPSPYGVKRRGSKNEFSEHFLNNSDQHTLQTCQTHVKNGAAVRKSKFRRPEYQISEALAANG